jgi:hypothetical protein
MDLTALHNEAERQSQPLEARIPEVWCDNVVCSRAKP